MLTVIAYSIDVVRKKRTLVSSNGHKASEGIVLVGGVHEEYAAVVEGTELLPEFVPSGSKSPDQTVVELSKDDRKLELVHDGARYLGSVLRNKLVCCHHI